MEPGFRCRHSRWSTDRADDRQRCANGSRAANGVVGWSHRQWHADHFPYLPDQWREWHDSFWDIGGPQRP